ncbi:MAG: hypothetical protein ACYTAQ_09805 [Planctomycetota bacterium]
MKPDHQCERGARLTPALLGLAIVLSLILGFGREHLLARGQETSRHLRATNPLRGFDPFDAPSAAGEMFLLRAAGLLLPPEPAPPRPAAGEHDAERDHPRPAGQHHLRRLQRLRPGRIFRPLPLDRPGRDLGRPGRHRPIR